MFTKGHSGNPKGKAKGTKDRFPRSARSAVKALLEKFACDTDLIDRAMTKGINARPPCSFPYIRLVVEQQVGQAEVPGVSDLAAALARKVVHECHPGPNKTA